MNQPATDRQINELVSLGMPLDVAKRQSRRSAKSHVRRLLHEKRRKPAAAAPPPRITDAMIGFERNHELKQLPDQARVYRYAYLSQTSDAGKAMDVEEKGQLIAWLKTFKTLRDPGYWQEKNGRSLLADFREHQRVLQTIVDKPKEVPGDGWGVNPRPAYRLEVSKNRSDPGWAGPRDT